MLKIGSTFYVSENAGQPKENMEDEADNVDPAGGSWILTMPGEDVRISAMWRPSFGSVDFTLPAALQAVGEEAFEGMKAGVVSVPDTCAAIGVYAFRNCRSLIQIRLPKDCEIADTAFAGCTSLVAIFAPAGGTTETWAKEHGIPFVPTDRIEIIISVDPPPVIVAGV